MSTQPELVESGNILEICAPMKIGMRVGLAVLACFPLLAPYELLIKIEWQDYLNLYFLFAATVSLGALAVSILFIVAALAGLNTRLVIYRQKGTLCHIQQVPLRGNISRNYPISSISRVEVGVREWSEGAPTYHLRFDMLDGSSLKIGACWSQDEIGVMSKRVNQFLASKGNDHPAGSAG